MSQHTGDMFSLNASLPVGGEMKGHISPKPKSSIGMSKKLGFGFVALVAIVVLMFFLALDKMDQNTEDRQGKAIEAADAKKETTQHLGIPTDLKGTQLAGSLGSKVSDPGRLDNSSASAGGRPNFVPPESAGDGANGALQTPEQLAAARKQAEREQREQEARSDGLQAKKFQEGSEPDTKNAASMALDALKANLKLAGMSAAGADSVASLAMQGDQEQKLNFMKNGGNAPIGQHAYSVVDPQSPYELHAGSVIPAILQMGVNSDLPGMVTAHVRENVYASVNHNVLLIPSTSKVIGSYDSRVALGQSRQLVVWNTLIYPDGKKLNLAGMPSADVSGQSGLDADVDNHWFRLFGVTLGMSMVTAGVQLSVPQTSNNNGQAGSLNSAQVVSTALAQQFGQLGGQMLGKYLQVQPTLRNELGERFNIVVPLTIVFPGPWASKKQKLGY
ncbi:TrbI/VirB10 family protein [Glaciimonas sp. GG7]